jgi:hypothetical protein
MLNYTLPASTTLLENGGKNMLQRRIDDEGGFEDEDGESDFEEEDEDAEE